MSEELRSEIDTLKTQMSELQALVRSIVTNQSSVELPIQLKGPQVLRTDEENFSESAGHVYYAGQYQANGQLLRWEPKDKQLEQLLQISTEKSSKILAALGSKPRLDIIIAILNESLTGAEIVEKLNMGTTGQLYHHLKALNGANLIEQDKSGRYTVPDHRKLPLLLLLSAAADMIDTSDYLDMVQVRDSAGTYLGNANTECYDANLLLWAVVENSILEHTAGYTTEVHMFLHQDGSATVSDNGRGIPIQAFQNSNSSHVQTILTDIHRFRNEAPYQVPGAEQGISIAVVNALTHSLTVEVQREGYTYRQQYKHGIPQTDLLTVGKTSLTGTSITFKADLELFSQDFNRNAIQQQIEQLAFSYPNLLISLH
ncbi:ArsR family transcriptional regulator [Paenibacillus agilis]|uniref:DNA topoisomerase (ATP-hydrolyzing) n=1 Tax=Paenibacillus agilis TaxID=3020863 RepID=A0A559J492_9BACL|nr:ArsR family transcriptional regulator [Paenibacillus agilis]